MHLPRFVHTIMCWLGIHGPGSYGLQHTFRSHYLGPRLRQCRACKATWLAGSEDADGRPANWTQIR